MEDCQTDSSGPRRGLLPGAILLLLGALLPALTAAQAPPEQAPSKRLAERLPALIQEAQIPGLAAAWVEDGKIAWTGAFGSTGQEGGQAVTDETVFEAASLSKPVFAYAVLRAVERGLLDLDRPLLRYLDYPDFEADPRLDSITARRVLSHTSGLPNWRRGDKLALAFTPGERFGYSGEGFVFLQKVVEKLTGLTGAEFVRREVLQPLKMDSSSFVWSPDFDGRAARGHDFLGEAQDKRRPEEANAAASLHTTATDYARFLREMLRPTLVKKATLTAMLSAQSQVENGVEWGLGWGLETVGDADAAGAAQELFFWHWGDNGAFRCLTLGSPSRRQALVYFTNSENGLAIKEEMIRLAFGPGAHPGPAWAGYDAYDSPAQRIRLTLGRAGREGGADALRQAYEDLRKTLPPEAFVERSLNNLGYQLLRGALDAAIEVFEINTQLYPDSANTYDSLAEAYMRRGDRELAIRNYAQSLVRDPDNLNAIDQLQKLRDKAGGS